jgi:hypothetical protein
MILLVKPTISLSFNLSLYLYLYLYLAISLSRYLAISISISISLTKSPTRTHRVTAEGGAKVHEAARGASIDRQGRALGRGVGV